jgi:hypothetical protein
MVRLVNTKGALLGVVLSLASCAVPRAIIVEKADAPSELPSGDALPAPVESTALTDDEIRLPDMLGLPSDGDFRSTANTPSAAGAQSGAVIARPPVDPASRAKPRGAGTP